MAKEVDSGEKPYFDKGAWSYRALQFLAGLIIMWWLYDARELLKSMGAYMIATNERLVRIELVQKTQEEVLAQHNYALRRLEVRVGGESNTVPWATKP